MDGNLLTALEASTSGGGLFGSSGSFGGVIKKTKSSEASLIKDYESMEKATKEYNKSFKEHLSNLNKLDDYANFDGMKNLFKKVIMKDVITQGAKVDTSMPLLFRNYHIEKEPTPSAFRREHILNQVRYILETSFAGREHMLIKYMSVEIGRSQFILHITTIENIKKSRTLDHSGYVIDAGGTRAALKDILSATKKNLRRRTALVEIDRGSSVGRSSRKKRTKKSSASASSVDSISSLLKSKKSSGTSRGRKSSSGRKSRSGASFIEEDTNFSKVDIGNSKLSIKSLPRKHHEPSNKLPSMSGLKSMKIPSKQSKPSIYMRPSEKRAAAGIPALPATTGTPGAPGMAMAPGAAPPMELTADFAAKKQELLGPGTAPAPALAPLAPTAPGYTAYPPAPGQQQETSAYQQTQQQQKPFVKCKDHPDVASCQADTSCFWDANYQSCKFNRPRNGRGPGGAPGGPYGAAAAPGPNPFGAPVGQPTGMSFPGAAAGPTTAPAAAPPAPMMDI